MKEPPKPKYKLDDYRKFIREAAPYVSILMGRKILPEDADRFTDQEMTVIALLIDSRAAELKKNGGLSGRGNA